jgi:hypothetical protein
MKPEHRLMLRKVGKGLPAREFKKGEMRTMDVRDSEMPRPSMDMLERKMAGMGVTKKEEPKILKRKPLKFKL